MSQNWTNKDIDSLADAFLSVSEQEEMLNFLRDLMTIREINTFSMRWKAANMLEAGVPYTEIEKVTGLSSATIARVNKFRKYGMGGYKKALSQNQ